MIKESCWNPALNIGPEHLGTNSISFCIISSYSYNGEHIATLCLLNVSLLLDLLNVLIWFAKLLTR